MKRKWKWSQLVVSDCATWWTLAHQAPPSMGFSRQEYWSGLPFPSPGDLPDWGIKPRSPALQADALTSEPPGKPIEVSKGAKELALNIKRGRNVLSQGKGNRKNPRSVLECRNGRKTDPYRLSLSHVVTINGFQVLLSNITCFPSYLTWRSYLPYSYPTQNTHLIQSANDPYPTPCTLGIKVY